MENLKDLNNSMLQMLHVAAQDYPHRPSPCLPTLMKEVFKSFQRSEYDLYSQL